MKFEIEELDHAGRTVATISGIGRNRGTLDTACYSRRTARRWLRAIRLQYPARRFIIAAMPAGIVSTAPRKP